MYEPPCITIGNKRSQCVLCPDVGGSIVSWAVDGQAILRDARSSMGASPTPLQLASFPLVPFSNRIGDARFEWAEQVFEITPNFPPEPHAIHGVGWMVPWTVAAVNASQCTLTMEHEADERWPWSFAATQRIELDGGLLHIVSTATNRSDRPTPLSFGHHPYFDRQGASLRFHASTVLMNGGDALPSDALVPSGSYDFSNSGEIAGRLIDHCYAGWNGHASIAWDNRPLALDIESDLGAAVIYVPQDGATFCFEPVPHVNNALNRPDLTPGMPIIQPGRAFESVTTFRTMPASGS